MSSVVAAVVQQEVMTFRFCRDLATAAALELTFPVATVVAQLEVPPAVGHGVKPFFGTPQLGVA